LLLSLPDVIAAILDCTTMEEDTRHCLYDFMRYDLKRRDACRCKLR